MAPASADAERVPDAGAALAVGRQTWRIAAGMVAAAPPRHSIGLAVGSCCRSPWEPVVPPPRIGCWPAGKAVVVGRLVAAVS